MARRAGAARERRHWRFRPAAAWLLLGCAAPTAARRPEPLAHASALRLLKQLSSEGCRESVSIDIGGTLAKLVLFQPRAAASAPSEPPIFDTYRELSIYVPALGGDLHFLTFETRHVEDILQLVHDTLPRPTAGRRGPIRLRATGGGSYKHAAAFRSAGLDLEVGDEMGCIVMGLTFLLRNVQGECFTLQVPRHIALKPSSQGADVPGSESYLTVESPPAHYLYVSIGSGVSIVEVHDPSSSDHRPGRSLYRRIGGSSLGGSTFWGLVKLLTSCSTFDEVIRLTKSGASSNIDMLVGDIYAGESTPGRTNDVIAASFGKVSMRREEKRRVGAMFLLRYLRSLLRHYEEGFWLVLLAILNSVPGARALGRRLGILSLAESRAASMAMCGNFRAHDVALSLLRMVANNIGHVSTLSAQQARLDHIIFGGSFIRDHPFTISTIASAVRFYSSHQIQPLFLRHDGFVGAIGAHVRGSAVVGACERMPQPMRRPNGEPPFAAPPPPGGTP